VLTFDGEVVDDLDALILETLGEEDAFSYDLYMAVDISRSVMSPDESTLVFGVPWQPRTRRLAEAWNGRVGFAVCYCSAHDDCWQSTLNGGEPDEVDACPIPE